MVGRSPVPEQPRLQPVAQILSGAGGYTQRGHCPRPDNAKTDCTCAEEQWGTDEVVPPRPPPRPAPLPMADELS